MGFNSMIVRLKVIDFAEYSAMRNSFNSMIVRLKVIRKERTPSNKIVSIL